MIRPTGKVRKSPVCVPRGLVEPLESRTLLTAVTSVSIVNADTDRIIGTIINGAVVDLAKLGATNINLVANGDRTTQSVRFALDTRPAVLDSTAPFTYMPLVNQDHSGFAPSAGSHRLVTTAYAKKLGKGAATTQTLNFTIATPTSTPTSSPTTTPSPTQTPTSSPTPTPSPTPTASPTTPPATTAPNAAPSVTLVNPVAGNFAGPGYFAARATASDSDGTISRVEFFANGERFATSTAEPHLASWLNVASGTYSVVARAFDDRGEFTDSAAAVVTVGAPAAGDTFVVEPLAGDDLNNRGSYDQPLRTLGRAAQLAGPGDTILLRPGTYYEGVQLNVSGTAAAPIRIKAEQPGTVVVDGTDLATGTERTYLLTPGSAGADHIWLSGIVFQNANNPGGGSVSAVKTDDGWRVEDCVIQSVNGNGLGIFGRNTVVRGVTSQDNGCSGIAGSSVKNAMLLDSVSRRNNTLNFSGSFEGGGGKFTRVDGFLVDNYESYENNGPGLWFDYNNINVVVRKSAFHHNRSLTNADGSERIGGRGLQLEISGVVESSGVEVNRGAILVEDNLIYDNAGAAIQVYATSNAHIRRNTVVNDTIDLKDKRPAPFVTKNLTMVDNFFKSTRLIADSYTTTGYETKNFVIDRNTYDNPNGQLWRWNSSTYMTTLAEIQTLGFEQNGKIAPVSYTPRPPLVG